jgi:5-methylcytosine-specific restriction endonuclease McrA
MTTGKSSNNQGQGKIKLSAREGSLEACVSRAASGGGLLFINIAPKGDGSRTIAVMLNVNSWSKDKSVTIVYGPDLKNVTVDNVDTQEGFSKLIDTLNNILNKLGISQSIAVDGAIAGMLRQVFQDPRRFYDAASYSCGRQHPDRGQSRPPKVGGKPRGGNIGGGGGASTAASAGSGYLHRVTCVPCGGCCGGQKSKALRDDWYQVLTLVAKALGVGALCEVINNYPDIFCETGLATNPSRELKKLKELERVLSREGVFKGSYITKRLLECGDNVTCWEYVELGVEGWYRLRFLRRGRTPGDSRNYADRLARVLGFRSVVDWGIYLHETIRGLVDPIFTDKYEGYKDIHQVRCRLCGEVLDTTAPLPAFLVNLTKHMKVHGINTIEDVRRMVEELRRRIEGRRGEVGKRRSIQVEQLEKLDLIGYLIRLAREVGLVDALEGGGFACNVCGRDFGGEVELVDHIIHAHADLNRVVPTVDRFAGEIRKLGIRSGVIEREGDEYRCTLCGAVLRSPADVTEHILTHLGEIAWLVRRVREGNEAKEEGGSPPGKGGGARVQSIAPVPVAAPAPAAQPVAAELVDPHVIVYGDIDDKPLYGCGFGFQCYPYFYFEWAVEEYGLPGPLVGKRTRFIPLPRTRHLITNGDVLNIWALTNVDLGTVNTIVRWFMQSFILDPMYRCTLPDMGGTVSGELIHEGRNRLTMTLYTREIAELVINHGILGGGAGDGVDVKAVEGIVDAMFRVFSEALKPPIIARYHRGGDETYLVLKLPNPCPPTETTLVARVGGKTKAGSIYMSY